MPATIEDEYVVLREWQKTPCQLWQEREWVSSGMIYSVQVDAPQVGKHGGLVKQPLVRSATKAVPSKPDENVACAAGKVASDAEAGSNSGDAPCASRDPLQPLKPNPASSVQPDGTSPAAGTAAAQPAQQAAGSEALAAAGEPAEQRPTAVAATCSPPQPRAAALQPQQQQDVAMAEAAEVARPAAAQAAVAASEPPAAAAAAALPPKTPARSRLSQATAARDVPPAGEAGATATVSGAARPAATLEWIHYMLAQLPEGATLEQRQAALVEHILKGELKTALDAQRDAGADAAVIAEVAAVLSAPDLLPALLPVALKRAEPEAPVWAALAAAHGQQPRQGADEPASCGAMADAERAARATAALEARLAAMLEEQARWDELKAQRLALTPERPVAAATGQLDDATPGAPAEAVAAARQEAHQQLTLQVEGLCALVEGATALLDSADLTSARLQQAYEAAAFADLPNVGSPATLIRRAIRPLPPPPTPAAERAAREA